MRVAIISKEGRGKTVFTSLFAGVFALSQKKQVCICATGNAIDYLRYNQTKQSNASMQSTPILQVVGTTQGFTSDEAYNYGVRLGENDVFLYNVFDSTEADDTLYDLMTSIMKEIPARLRLVEVNGSYLEDSNRRILDEVDAILYLFEQTPADIEEIKQYNANMGLAITAKTGFVCTKFDDRCISEKKIATDARILQKNLFSIAYISELKYLSYIGELNKAVVNICRGKGGMAILRTKMVDIMKWLFNSPTRKYIKEVKEWKV